jgi:hypothetical protein
LSGHVRLLIAAPSVFCVSVPRHYASPATMHHATLGPCGRGPPSAGYKGSTGSLSSLYRSTCIRRTSPLPTTTTTLKRSQSCSTSPPSLSSPSPWPPLRLVKSRCTTTVPSPSGPLYVSIRYWVDDNADRMIVCADVHGPECRHRRSRLPHRLGAGRVPVRVLLRPEQLAGWPHLGALPPSLRTAPVS